LEKAVRWKKAAEGLHKETIGAAASAGCTFKGFFSFPEHHVFLKHEIRANRYEILTEAVLGRRDGPDDR
jgi:hypothetical protein